MNRFPFLTQFRSTQRTLRRIAAAGLLLAHHGRPCVRDTCDPRGQGAFGGIVARTRPRTVG